MSKKLFVPGPIDVSEDVLGKMATQVISHRGIEASKLQENIKIFKNYSLQKMISYYQHPPVAA